MITGFDCATYGDRFQTLLIQSFERDGKPHERNGECLFLTFGHLPASEHGLYRAAQFDEPWINVSVPRFLCDESGHADLWLMAYAREIRAHLDEGAMPRIVRDYKCDALEPTRTDDGSPGK